MTPPQAHYGHIYINYSCSSHRSSKLNFHHFQLSITFHYPSRSQSVYITTSELIFRTNRLLLIHMTNEKSYQASLANVRLPGFHKIICMFVWALSTHPFITTITHAFKQLVEPRQLHHRRANVVSISIIEKTSSYFGCDIVLPLIILLRYFVFNVELLLPANSTR